MRRKKMRCKALGALGSEKMQKGGGWGMVVEPASFTSRRAAQDAGRGRCCSHSHRHSEKLLQQYLGPQGKRNFYPVLGKGVLKAIRR